MAENDIDEMHALVNGYVQGVFFRATTRDYANRMRITGTVKNLPDGTVEIYAQGKKEDLDRLVEKLKGASGPGHVDSISTDFYKPTQLYDSFRIVH